MTTMATTDKARASAGTGPTKTMTTKKKTKRKTNRPTTIDDVRKAAVLAGDGLSQGEIAAALDVSQPTVSRLIDQARHKGFLQDRPRCKLDPVEQATLRQEVFPEDLDSRLLAALGKTPAQLRVVVIDGGKGETGEPAEPGEDAFANGVARFLLHQAFPRARNMGIAWGANLQNVVGCIEQHTPADRRAEKPISFVPICGDPPDMVMAPERSSSLLAAQLDTSVNGAVAHSFSLAGVAASIPPEVPEADVPTIRRFLNSLEHYGDIFGKDGVIDELDAILTGVGRDTPEDNPLQSSRGNPGKDARRLDEITIGNIAGVFLVKPDHEAYADEVKRANDRWTCVRFDHIKKCAARARRRKGVGVIVVARGDKADIVRACVDKDLVNVLIVERRLAREIIDRSDPPPR